MIVIDKEEILDFPFNMACGSGDYIFDCICKCGLGDRVQEGFELAGMIINAYKNYIKTATEYEVDVSERF